MKIVRLKGGLGNQMFQYAFAKLLEHTFREEVKLDFSAYSSLMDDPIRQPRLLKYKLSLPIATRSEVNNICLFPHFGNSQSNFYRFQILLEKIFNRNYLFEKKRNPLDLNAIGKYSFYDGYWQACEYIDVVSHIIKNDFVPNVPISDKTFQFIELLLSHPTTFVGIRRGDFLDEREHYGTISNEYYLNAMDLIASKYPNTNFLIFTNDVEWCKDNMNFANYHVEYREKYMQVDDFEELMIMRSCQNAIISNSTFNWWGAYLIDNPEKIVVCPETWFTDDKPIDIIPNSWIKMRR